MTKEFLCPCKEQHTWEHCASYNEGILKEFAFVFSCPGNAEKKAQYPTAGETGKTFDLILKKLQEKKIIPEFKCRYEFRIANATQSVESKSETNKTESTDKAVADPDNISRLKAQIEDCQNIICFGRKAEKAVSKCILKSITVRHPSNNPSWEGIAERDRESRANYIVKQIEEKLLK